MKKVLLLISIIGLNSLSASTVTTEEMNKKTIMNLLVKDDYIIEREVRQSRDVRQSRKVRKNRIVRMGRKSRGIRSERAVRMVKIIRKKKEHSTEATTFIKKLYLSKVTK